MQQELRIVVASPNDVLAERECISRVLADLNSNLALQRNVYLELSRWETDSYPGFHHDGPQGLIDPILRVEDCDILIGIFWTKFGTPVGDAESGTEHEFRRAFESWQKKGTPHIMFYFNRQPYWPSKEEELDQWKQVLRFKREFPREGLWWEYEGVSDFEKLVRQHLENYIGHSHPFPRRVRVKGTQPRSTPRYRDPDTLFDNYRARIFERVSTVYIFGESAPRELKRVFVDLTINEEYKRPIIYSEVSHRVAMDPRGVTTLPEDEDGDESIKTHKALRGRNKRTVKPDDLLRNKANLVIAGAPGCGKTTLLRYLALKTHEENKQLPVFLELKTVTRENLKRAGNNLPDLLFNKAVAGLIHLYSAERRQMKAQFLNLLAEGKVAVFLDGLDEISGAEYFASLCQAINEFVQSDYGETSIIVSTRPQALESRFDRFREVEIAQLNRIQIGEFLEHYYGETTARRFVQIFHRNAQLRDLMRVPFLLAVIVKLHETRNIIVENRLELYRQIVLRLAVKLNQEKRVVRSHFQLKDPKGLIKLDLLKHLAYESLIVNSLAQPDEEHLGVRTVLTAKMIVDNARSFVIKNALKEVNPYQLVDDVIATPLLREVGADTYAFAHLTIHEYLAAVSLSEQPDTVKRFCECYFNPSLAESEVLPMSLGLAQDPGRLYEMLKILPESLNFASLRIRARGLCYTSKIDERQLRELNTVLASFLGESASDKVPYRDAVMQSFYGVSAPMADSLAALIKVGALRSWEPSFTMLGQLGGETAIRKLCQVLGQTWATTPIQRTRVAELLGEVGGETAVAALVESLSDSDAGVRAEVTGALGKIAADSSVPALSNALSDSDKSVRLGSVAALEQMRSKSATLALVAALKLRFQDVRCRAAEALGKRTDEEAIAALIKARASSIRSVSLSALDALTGIETEAAWNVVQAALSAKDPVTRLRAVGGLARSKSKRAFTALVESLRDEDSAVRTLAGEALQDGECDGLVRALIDCLYDQDPSVRLACTASLSNLGGAEAVTALSKVLQDESEAIREAAVRALQQIGSEEAHLILIEALSSHDVDVCGNVMLSLGNLRESRATDALVEKLNHESSYLRACAAEALGLIGQGATVDALTQLIADDDAYVRGRVATALGLIGGETAFQTVLTRAADPSIHVRIRVASALGSLAQPAAVNVLTEMLSDWDFDVRLMAAQALNKIGGNEAADALFHSWDTADFDFRTANWRNIVGSIWSRTERSPAKLASALRDPDFSLSVIDALGELAEEESIVALVEVLMCNQPDNVLRAALALGRFDTQHLAGALVRALDHPNSSVRQKASETVVYYDRENRAIKRLFSMWLLDPDLDVNMAAAQAIDEYRAKASYLGINLPTLDHCQLTSLS